jgi:hypothetical protein
LISVSWKRLACGSRGESIGEVFGIGRMLTLEWLMVDRNNLLCIVSPVEIFRLMDTALLSRNPPRELQRKEKRGPE